MTAATALARPQLDNKILIDRQLWDRLTIRIVHDHGVEHSYAERIMDQALGFLRLCAMCPGRPFAPSATVDIGWHTFILYTREYAAFCERVAGHFIHHAPNDDGDDSGVAGGMLATLDAMSSSGISIDEALWTAEGGSGRPCEAHECRTVH